VRPFCKSRVLIPDFVRLTYTEETTAARLDVCQKAVSRRAALAVAQTGTERPLDIVVWQISKMTDHHNI